MSVSGKEAKQVVLADSGLTECEVLERLIAAEQVGQPLWVDAKLLPTLRQAGLKPVTQDGVEVYHFRALGTNSLRRGWNVGSWLIGEIGIILTAPLLLILLLAVWLADGWPLIFSHLRVGRDGAVFKIYKLRTIREQDKKSKERARAATPLGGWLRRNGLDEIPQFFNLCKGDMALIGPRPLPLDEYPRCGLKYEWLKMREKVKPGLTGLYQVTPGRRELSMVQMCLLDGYWLHNRSMRLGWWVVRRTVRAMLGGWGG